jgi:hypothetical protein
VTRNPPPASDIVRRSDQPYVLIPVSNRQSHKARCSGTNRVG